jgi:hypothetical protein
MVARWHPLCGKQRLRTVDRLVDPKEIVMNESDLPKFVLGRIEQRWASRLQREASAWSSERPVRGAAGNVVDRSGRTIPVTIHSAKGRGKPADRVA